MGKKLDKAFDLMRENNRLYLEDQKKKNKSDPPPSDAATDGAAPDVSPDDAENIHALSETDARRGDDPKERERPDEKKIELEKGDLPAMILSAMLVFGPVILILAALVIIAWIFLH